MTVGELRRTLFHIRNQEMTVKELRALLFKAPYQEEEILDEYALSRLEKEYL